MKYYYACAIGLVFLFGHSTPSYAQGHFPPSYTPHVYPALHSPDFIGYYGTISLRHKFKIVFTDGTDTIVYSKIYADTPSYYLQLENKAVKKKDPARFTKIYPSDTKYIVCLDRFIVSRDLYVPFESKGMTTDSCWLFKAIDGKVSAYAPLAEVDVDDDLLLYIQKDDGPIVQINSQNLQEMVSTDEKAARLAEKKRYTKAIKIFNKSAQTVAPNQ